MLKYAAAMIRLLAVLVFVGCSSSSRPEDLADRSMDDVYNEVDKLSTNALKHRAEQYTQALKIETAKLQQLRDQEDKLPYSEKTGTKASEIGKQMSKVGFGAGRTADAGSAGAVASTQY